MNVVTFENWTLNSVPAACDFTWSLPFTQPRKSTDCTRVFEFWLCFNFGELLKNKSKWTQKGKQFNFFNATGPMHTNIMLEIVKLFGEEHFAQTDIRLNLWLVM